MAAADAEYVVIKDSIAYQTGRLITDPEWSVISFDRGDTVTAEAVGQDQIDAWLDAEVHPPYGAIAPKGSELGKLLSDSVAVAADPQAVAARVANAAGVDPNATHTDPAGEPSDEVKTGVDPAVAQAAELAEVAAGDQPTEPESLESLSKDDLKSMADGLGIEYPKSATKAELIELIQAKQSESTQG